MPHPPNNLTELDDNQLVALTQNGNQLAFRTLITRLEAKLMAFLLKRCSNRADAQDILQDSFLAAYNNLHQFDPTRPFSAWMFGITRNQANNHFRKIKPLPEPSTIADPHDATTPLTKVDRNDQANAFWNEAHRLLSEDEFDAIWLRYQENLPLKEIAAALDKTLSNIKILLFRARKSLSTSSFLAEQHFSASNIAS